MGLFPEGLTKLFKKKDSSPAAPAAPGTEAPPPILQMSPDSISARPIDVANQASASEPAPGTTPSTEAPAAAPATPTADKPTT